MRHCWRNLFAAIVPGIFNTPLAAAGQFELQGFIGADARTFFESAQFQGQESANGSIVLQPELYYDWDSSRQSLLFVPFIREDSADSARSHADIRELTWLLAREQWELRIGVRQVFWGVAESNHLVDIINQTDLVENPDGEDKLGQPMVNLALIRPWGTIDLFVLPGFRERTFPGRSGRLRLQPRTLLSTTSYESGARKDHVDFAIRYSLSVGDLDFGIYQFKGTSREPRLRVSSTGRGESVLSPHYDQIDQTGLDLLYAWGDWLLKLEALHRSGQGDAYAAAVGGFEYTFTNVLAMGYDLGVLGEYHWDERNEAATTPFNGDVFGGVRLALNDTASSSVLVGVLTDVRGNGNFFNLEGSRRLGERWKAELELRVFWGGTKPDLLQFMNQDDYLGLSFARYF